MKVYSNCNKHENYKHEWWKDMSKSKFKIQNKITKSITKTLNQEHKMCKTKVQIYLYCDEIQKHKHKKTKIWCKIVF